MPSRVGARITAARRLVAAGHVRSVEEYLSRRADGERWCSDCTRWHPESDMLPDRWRPGGRAGRCGRNRRRRTTREA